MVTSNFSGKSSCSKNSPWLDLEHGTTAWNDFSSRDKEEIVRYFAPKIRILALRMKGKLPNCVELGELMSAGSLGLLDALGKFRPALKIKFDTYAENRIKGAMLDELRRMDWFSRGLRKKIKHIEEAIRDIENQTGHSATPEQVEQHTGMDSKEVHFGMEALQNQLCISLDSFKESFTGHREGIEENEPYQSTAFQELVNKIAELIENLTEREKLVISLYYGEELNMKETAEVMDITEGRVSQLHAQALGKLRREYLLKYEDTQ